MLTKKEEEFCRVFALTGDINEAAAMTGYTRKKAMLLLTDPKAKKFLKKVVGKESVAMNALRRIAFASPKDAVLLAVKGGELSAKEIEKLDLAAVAHVGRDKNGELELKLYDRQKAIELIIEQEEKSAGSGAQELIKALEKSAGAGADEA